jgi:alkylhydroperoxidase family enzyme
MVRDRGWVSPTDLEAFLQAGYTQGNVLDVITIVALKTISNYSNHIARTPVDQAFQAHAWKKPTSNN